MSVKSFIGSFVLVFLLSATNTKANNLENPFASISLTTAKEIAQVEGKYVFIDFYADWCVPCKWMDETTYADRNVINTLQNDFVSVKVNIDDFDGFTLKEEYNVRVLPTVIVLDQNGKVVRRYEESMSPSKLKDVLVEISGNDNSNINHNKNISPSEIKKNGSFETQKNGNRTLESNATVKTNKSYRVQVGAFTDYANTLNLVDNLNTQFDEPVIVLNSYVNDATVYKVFVGDFEKYEEADRLKNSIIKKFGVKGFVKSFE